MRAEVGDELTVKGRRQGDEEPSKLTHTASPFAHTRPRGIALYLGRAARTATIA